MRIFIVLLIPVFIFADEVALQNGATYTGKIISADQNYIYVQLTDTTTAKIPQQLVKSVFFTYSDLVYLLSGEVMECKIVDKGLTDLIVITGQGPVAVKLLELKRYFYNAADSLHLPGLPVTGDFFNNQKIFEQQKKISGKYLMLGIGGGFSGLPAEKWNARFITSSKLLGLTAGCNFIYSLQPHLLTNLGFEYTLYQNNFEELQSEVKRYFLYMGLAYLSDFSLIRDVQFYAGADLGLNFLDGNIYTFSYRNVTIQDEGIKLGIRPYLAAETLIIYRLSVRVQCGYLLGRSFSIKPGVDYLKNIDIDYNGPVLMFQLYYQFPL